MLAGTYKESFSDLLFHDGRPMLEIKIEYLRANGQVTEEFERSFNSYEERKARLLNLTARSNMFNNAVSLYSQTKKQGLPFNMFSVAQTEELTFASERYLSVIRKTSVYSGGAHEYTKMTSDVWSLRQSRRLSLRDISGIPDILGKVTEKVKQVLTEDKSGKYFPDAKRSAVRNFDPKDFFLTEKGISVFYPIYTLAPYYAGIQIFETGIQPL